MMVFDITMEEEKGGLSDSLMSGLSELLDQRRRAYILYPSRVDKIR